MIVARHQADGFRQARDPAGVAVLLALPFERFFPAAPALKASDLTAFLKDGVKPAAPPAAPEPRLVAAGRSEFIAGRCAQCHDTGETLERTADAVALADLNAGASKGCLSDSPRSPADAGKQIEQIWVYLKELDQSPLPPGMASQSFVIVPDKEPVVFRTFMEHAGMQAIAVGFPRKIHAAFDAHQMRWAVAWRGGFLDAEATWGDRFSPLTKPLGDDVHKLPGHAPLAILKSESDAWPKAVGKAAGYVFRGYRLDKAGVPTLMYSFADVELTDRLEPGKDGKSLRRTVTIAKPPANLFFRGVTGKPMRVEAKGGSAVIEEVITW